ncbi:MAG: YqiA/YcfP family alpha/beta fold hydrolase [Thermodesulfobacteriota bacterium]|nr:YqiA/YcfP family alpha/beta fold hydrolase [Thermodesulfobacteriota bacterium]
MTAIFLHGLDSSSKGRKGRFFRAHFPDMLVPDFSGDLQSRMTQLNSILNKISNIIMIGSSYGGLMATLYAMSNENRVKKIILLAPALNFAEFAQLADRKISVPTWIYLGSRDEVTPLVEVKSAAMKTFSKLKFLVSDDDHFLRRTFAEINWHHHFDR